MRQQGVRLEKELYSTFLSERVLMKNIKLKYLFTLLLLFFYPHYGNAEICTPIQKVVKYRVIKGDHLASILRNFKLEPVFCQNCSLSQVLKLNHVKDQNQIHPNQLLKILFKCEEDLKSFQIVDQDEHQLILFPRQIASTLNLNHAPSANVKNENQLRPEVYLAARRSISTETGFVVAAEEKNSQIQNGENNWSKIDCKGLIIDGQCVNKLDSYYVKVKNTYLTYDFEDDARRELYNLSSWLNPGVETGLIKQLTKNWSLLASVDLMYKNVRSNRYNIETSKNIFFAGSVNSTFRISENYCGLGLLAAQENYYIPTGTKLETKTEDIIYLNLLFGHTWFNEGTHSLTTEFSLSLSEPKAGMPGPKSSQIFTAKNEFVFKDDDGYYILGADVGRHEQNTNLTHQANWEVLLAAGIGWFL